MSEFKTALSMHLGPGRKDQRKSMLNALLGNTGIALELYPADLATVLTSQDYQPHGDGVRFADTAIEQFYQSLGAKKKLFKKVTAYLRESLSDMTIRKLLGFGEIQTEDQLTEEEPEAKPVAEPGSLFDPRTEEGEEHGDEHGQ